MGKSEEPNIVHPEILEQIYLARTSLYNSPDFDLTKRARSLYFLNMSASKHSVDFEMQGMNKRKARKKAYEDIMSAYYYLIKNCSNMVEEDKIKIAASLINGYSGSKLPYRGDRSTTDIGGRPFIYTSPEDIPNEIYRFIQENNSLSDPVEKAVHSHFHIARIHPFNDGNGRLARLVQNCILDCADLPPIITKTLERNEYLSLLQDAEIAYRSNGGSLKPDQVKYYNYLALKVRDSLNEVKNKICS